MPQLDATTERPRLLLYVTRQRNPQRNVVAATLAWVAEATGQSFEVYLDAFRLGRHVGSGEAGDAGAELASAERLGWLTGGLVAGGRHHEAVALALLRFRTTVVCSGDVSLANLLAAVAWDGGAEVMSFPEGAVTELYDAVLSRFGVAWPSAAVVVDGAPVPGLAGVDAYVYPEIFYARAIGVEASCDGAELRALRDRGVRRLSTIGVGSRRRDEMRGSGFEVDDLGLIGDGDDFATVTARIAGRWTDRRRGWIVGDPVLVSSWIPAACREHRAAIYGVPQSRVIEMLRDEIAAHALPTVLGRQFHDSDFFTLSRLGQSFQVIDPARPPLPVLTTLPTPWSASVADPRSGDPTDDELRAHVRARRVLVSLVFWTGMIREVENLYAVTDLVATTGLRAGLALTSESLRYRPSPLDLLSVPREQGGVFPHLEILLGSSGTGVSIESLMAPAQLREHLTAALDDMRGRGVPGVLMPDGWWPTMDAPMERLPKSEAPGRIRIAPQRPHVRIRFHSREVEAGRGAAAEPAGGDGGGAETAGGTRRRALGAARRRAGAVLRGSRLERHFEAYRPYEDHGPGPLSPELATAVRDSGLSYMLTKSGFGDEPRIVHREGDFVALNHTSGRWDGWTPFETINDVSDLRRAERTLLRRGKPGWLLGSIDTCLWAFSGELWHAAPRLAAIAENVASGGTSGRLVNVAPRVLARYARLIDAEGDAA